jgi:FMN reductase
MPKLRLVGFVGNLRRPSRSRALVEALGAEIARQASVDLRVYDILDAGPGFPATLARADLPLPAARILDAIESADALIVGTPVYKGAYTGLFKHAFDLLDPARLAGKPVAITATGGGHRHALVVEHALRPLFGFFAALTVPTAVYAADADFRFDDNQPVLTDPAVAERLAQAGSELVTFLEAAGAAARPPAPSLRSARR